MKFVFKPYALYQMEGHTYCYTHQTSAKITHPPLIHFLETIAQQKLDLFTQEEIELLLQRYSLHHDSTLKFLMENLRILTWHDEEQFQNLYIFSDNAEVKEALTQEFFKHYGITVIVHDRPSSINKPKSLVLLFNEHYQEQHYKDLYSLPHLNDTFFITAFLVDKYLIIDNLYNKQKGVPCHFCNVNHLKTTAITSPEIQHFSWLIFYRQLLKGKENFFPATPLTVMNKHLVVYTLCQYIKRYLDPAAHELWHDNINEFWHVDLERNQIEKEAATHWELCHCMHA